MQNAADECIFPCIKFDTAQITIVDEIYAYTRLTHLLILAKSSLINLVRRSRFFICCSCIFFSILAIVVFSGIEMIMIATPTKADHPRRLYNDTKASVI
jgi:hypothetical protein